MDIAIDLDETIINNSMNGKWEIMGQAIKNLYHIQKMGYRFHLITARPSSQLDDVARIVEQIEKRLNIIFQTITCTSYSEKSSSAHRLRCKVIIDDQYNLIRKSYEYGIQGVLFGTKTCSDSHMICCETWDDVKNYLLNFKNQ